MLGKLYYYYCNVSFFLILHCFLFQLFLSNFCQWHLRNKRKEFSDSYQPSIYFAGLASIESNQKESLITVHLSAHQSCQTCFIAALEHSSGVDHCALERRHLYLKSRLKVICFKLNIYKKTVSSTCSSTTYKLKRTRTHLCTKLVWKNCQIPDYQSWGRILFF